MHKASAIFLCNFLAWAGAKDQFGHHWVNVQNSEDNLIDEVVGNVVERLFDRVLSMRPLHHADLESTALGKPGHLALSTSHISTPSTLNGRYRPVRNMIAHGLSGKALLHAQAERTAAGPALTEDPSRRQALLAGSLGLAGAVLPAMPSRAEEFKDTKMVGAFLPESKLAPGLYEFVAGPRKTPAIRAGSLQQYSFALPGSWKEAPISNARSGNYCQPRCDEATTEVLFESPKEGSLQVIIIPTTKLNIGKNDPTIEDVGSEKQVLNAIGPAITGSVPVDVEEEIEASKPQKIGGKTYYTYELLTPEALYGLHNFVSVSTNKNYVILCAVTASEKQYSAAKDKLAKVVETFRVGITDSGIDNTA